MMTFSLLSSLVALTFSFSPLPAAEDSQLMAHASHLDVGRKALKNGDLDKARSHFSWALRMKPNDPATLESLSQAYEEQGSADSAVYYAFRARQAFLGQDKVDRKALDKIDERIEKMSPEGTQILAAVQTFTKDLAGLGKKYFGKRYYQNAADAYGKVLKLDPNHKDAAKYVEKIQKASVGSRAAASLASRLKKTRSPEWIARQDRRHRDWQKAYSKKTPNYKIKTNIGYEAFQTAIGAMEPINQFYRKVYRHREKGGGTPVLQIILYATRKEYEDHRGGNVSRTVRGHFSPTSGEVVTYDPRSEGGDLDSMWRTLFHEASHQFTDLVTNVKPPMWLNEGIASYFEGCRFMDDGTIETNGIPPTRFRGFMMALEGGRGVMQPVPLDRVILAPKSEYDANYYNHGWALIYYLRNFESEDGENIYQKPLEEILKSFKKGGKHDALERFEEHFVKGVKRQGIDSVKDLEADWHRWMRELQAELAMGAGAAPKIVARGDRYVENGKLEKARDAYLKALRFVPDDHDTRRRLAAVYEDLDSQDQALHEWKALAEARRTEGEDIKDELKKIDALDPILKDRKKVEGKLVGSFEKQLGALSSKDFDLTVYLANDMLGSLLGETPEIQSRRDAVEAKIGDQIDRWRWIFNGENLEGWVGDNDRFDVEDLGLSAIVEEDDDSPALMFFSESFSGDYQVRFRPRVDGESLTVFGFGFGAEGGGRTQFALISTTGTVILAELDPETRSPEITVRKRTPHALEDGDRVTLKVSGRDIEILVGKNSLLTHSLDEYVVGKVGLRVELGEVRFEEVEVLRESS